jgi:hypothetical protein
VVAIQVPLDVYGEWVPAFVGMGLAFLVAASGVIGLGWWVLRGDRLNREHEAVETTSEGAEAH